MPMYDRRIFDASDMAAAKRVILTPEQGLTPEERWSRETHWLSRHIQFELPKGALVVDYGCGIGRLVGILPMWYPVLGVDISPAMRRMAGDYVARPNFGIVSPEMFEVMTLHGMIVHGAMAVWSLQHMEDPGLAIRQLAFMMPQGAPFYVVNRDERVVPTTEGWFNDGIVVDDLLREKFYRIAHIEMPLELCTKGAYLSKWERR